MYDKTSKMMNEVVCNEWSTTSKMNLPFKKIKLIRENSN